MKKLSYLMALALMSFISVSQADGPGPTSQTQLFIQGQAGPFVQVTGVKDIIIDNWDGNRADPTTNPMLKQNICVLTNSGSDFTTGWNTYNIQIRDENGTLALKNTTFPDQASIPYVLRFKSPADSIDQEVKSGQQFFRLHGSVYDHCWTGGTNAELDVIIPSVTNPIAGTYGDTIHLVVTPTE